MSVQRAVVVAKSAPLSSDFGRSFVERRFGTEAAARIYALLPKFTRGPRKGLVKGSVYWDKCTVGGWVRDGVQHAGEGARGYVQRPGTSNVRIALTDFGSSLQERSSYASRMTEQQWMEVVEQVVKQIFGGVS